MSVKKFCRTNSLLGVIAALTFPAIAAEPGATDLQYFLPEASVKIGLDVTLLKCPTAKDPNYEFKTNLTLVGAAGAASEALTVTGKSLESWNKDYQLKIKLKENRTIASINSASTDKTADIIGSAFGFLSSFIPFMKSIPSSGARMQLNTATSDTFTPTQHCNQATINALAEVTKLETLRDNLNSKLHAQSEGDATAAYVDALNNIAGAIAKIRTEKLTVTAAKSLVSEDGTPWDDESKVEEEGKIDAQGKPAVTPRSGPIWTIQDFGLWFRNNPTDTQCAPVGPGVIAKVDASNPCKAEIKFFETKFTVTLPRGVAVAPPESRFTIPSTYGDSACFTARPATLKEKANKYDDAYDYNPKCHQEYLRCMGKEWSKKPNPCLVFRSFRVANVSATLRVREPAGNPVGQSVRAAIQVPTPQWGEKMVLPLKVGFGDKRTLAMTFDDYGRATEFDWQSGARGEAVMGGLNTIFTGAAGLRTALTPAAGPSEVDQWKSEIDRLETMQKLNKLRACEAIIEAGGTVCPN